jgi:hypothetical protein
MSEATEFAKLRPEQFVTLSGLSFESGTSDWHVNDVVGFNKGEKPLNAVLKAMNGQSDTMSGTYRCIVLQRADASAEWLGIVIKSTELGWDYEQLFRFKGSSPSRMDPPTLEAVGDDAEGLGDDDD